MKSEVKQNKEFAQWLGEWIPERSKPVTGLNNWRTSPKAPRSNPLYRVRTAIDELAAIDCTRGTVDTIARFLTFLANSLSPQTDNLGCGMRFQTGVGLI
jgi:hypothetical protein